jgi:predicted HicB family RNase H-like nuclease
MSKAKRTTVYFDPEIHRALRLKAAVSDRTVSDLVNEAVKLSLTEDDEDMIAFEERATDPVLDFEDFARNLRPG